MYLYKLLPSLGKLITSTGNRNFPRELHNLIASIMAIDATQMTEIRIDASDTSRPLVSGFGGTGSNSKWVEDTLNNLSKLKPAWFMEQMSSTSSTQENRHAFNRLRAPQRKESLNNIHLVGKTKGRCYALSVYRSDISNGFSPIESAFLTTLSKVLLPVIGDHLMAAMPMSGSTEPKNANDLLRKRFNRRLEILEINLSPRELEVCLGFLSGDTAKELAKKLNIKTSTIETYLRRASIKLNIEGRHALMRWAYTIDKV